RRSAGSHAAPRIEGILEADLPPAGARPIGALRTPRIDVGRDLGVRLRGAVHAELVLAEPRSRHPEEWIPRAVAPARRALAAVLRSGQRLAAERDGRSRLGRHAHRLD